MLKRPPHPAWLRKKLVINENAFLTQKVMANMRLNTVCESSLCPNLNECFSKKTATFLILGRNCTRGCAFCSVENGPPAELDPGEALRISEAVVSLNLKYSVITSVTRDDLADGGASQYVLVVSAIRQLSRDVKVELLIPDFMGEPSALKAVVLAKPDVLSHNIETVNRLYPVIRPGASYERSLRLLRQAKEVRPDQLTKSGVMLGLGEEEQELPQVFKDIRSAGCDILTIGQYMRPDRSSAEVRRFVSPEEFKRYRKLAGNMGFAKVVAGPFVRSSYLAEEIYANLTEV